MSKQICFLKRHYILSKYFDYCLTKKDKVVVDVFFYPLLIKIKQISLSFSNRLPMLKFQCFDICCDTDMIYVNIYIVFLFSFFLPTDPNYFKKNPCPNKSLWFGLIIQKK